LKILFLVPTVSGSQISRAYPFAELLSKNHSVKILGKKDNGFYLKPSSRIPIQGTEKKSIVGMVAQFVKEGKQFDTICVSTPIFSTAIAGLLLKLHGKRFIFDIDDDELGALSYYKGKFFNFSFWRKYFPIKFSFLLRHFADAVTVASSILQKRYGGTVLPAPVDTTFFSGGEPLRVRKKFPGELIVYVGVVRRFKGIDTLVGSFPKVKEKIPNAKLLIVGGIDKGAFPKEIQRTANELSKDIYFLGFQPYATMPDFMQAADCLVLCNPDDIYHRAQTPIKLIHYMAAGKPIVATAVGDVTKILEDGNCGILVEPSNPEQLANGIVKAINDKVVANKISSAAFAKAKKEFDFSRNKEKIEKIYCRG